jgi:hypothetical protein
MERRQGFVHRGGRTTNDRLQGAVDIGQHHVTIDGLQNALNLSQRRGDGCHAAVILH